MLPACLSNKLNSYTEALFRLSELVMRSVGKYPSINWPFSLLVPIQLQLHTECWSSLIEEFASFDMLSLSPSAVTTCV